MLGWDPKAAPETGDRLPPRPRPAAGLHRRPRRRRPRRHARGHGRARRRPEQDQPAAARRPGHRPLGAGGPVRHRRPRSRPNAELEFERNRERYAFLRWGQQAFHNFRVVPPDTGICHQVNLEYLASRRHARQDGVAYPDTLVGTDSHTTMINGLGVVGWGVGGIEAEAAMLGQPLSMLIPQVVGFKLTGKLREGATATDLVLTVTQMLRKKGVVGKFVEFYGPGIAALSLADRATIANMAPEYGATIGFFPVDAETLAYLRFTGRARGPDRAGRGVLQGAGPLPHRRTPRSPSSRDTLELDLGDRRAQPRRPQAPAGPGAAQDVEARSESSARDGRHGSPGRRRGAAGKAAAAPPGPAEHVAAAATVTQGRSATGSATARWSSPPSPPAPTPPTPRCCWRAGLLAKKAVERGLGTQALGEDLARPRLQGRDRVPARRRACSRTWRRWASTWSATAAPPASATRGRCPSRRRRGQREGPGRRRGALRQPQLRGPHQPPGADELPRLAAAGRRLRAGRRHGHRPRQGALGTTATASPSTSRTSGPPTRRCATPSRSASSPSSSRASTPHALEGDEDWQELAGPRRADLRLGRQVDLRPNARRSSTTCPRSPPPLTDIHGARVLAVLGDSVTTDHISPAGNIAKNEPRGAYLMEHGVQPADFNSYGARRGNHEVMVRGTFANIRIKNLLLRGVEGGFTLHLPERRADEHLRRGHEVRRGEGPRSSSSPAPSTAPAPRATGRPRAPSSSASAPSSPRASSASTAPTWSAWASCRCSSTRARTRRRSASPARRPSTSAASPTTSRRGKKLEVKATGDDGTKKTFTVTCRIDTPNEVDYYQHGGILQFVLRQLAKA